ncbi:DNA-binding MarR family transcriptional regulator [Friedmanniella endophytica]|uniref:DNA-binding MarR family transcriptional regulator n=1 Tax=Microlunatus kandeliicorticis TaxID=1759536 RepID=A0A7W3IRZ6_9ACTN|nr:MarR family transcriptional regulator [Microlunatus kandeliicorticis]MBA8794080.1 DNA-binding MarR family transcriptional regulator [Microlunatus kandeliicorticis]
MPASLRLVARAVTQRFAEVLDRVDVPLTLVQLRALYALLDEPDGVPLRHWAQKLRMSDPSASRLGQRLERDGLVDRQAGAARALSVVITDRGREAVSQIEREQSRELYRMTEPLAAGDRSTLLSLVERLTDQARADHQERR